MRWISIKEKQCRLPSSARRFAVAKISVVMAVALAVVVVLPGSVADAEIDPDKRKSETVYAVLENSGEYSGATVVNCFAQNGEIVDYGVYTSIENMMGAQTPIIDGNKITWTAAATQTDGDFYYQGETDKALPVDIGITYYLNGIETAPDDIAGKTGTLKIAFEIYNMTGTGEIEELSGREIFTPFAVQVSLSLSNDMFTVTDMPKNATSMLAGSSQTMSYTSFPLPNDTFSFTMFGQDIVLDPINIVALPKAPPGLDAYGDFVDVDGMKDGIDEMSDGTEEMSSGTVTLLDALYDMKDAAQDLSSALGDIDRGAATLADGADAVYSNARVLAVSADDFYAAMSAYAASFAAFDVGMDALNTSVGDMAATLLSLSEAAALLDAGVIGMGDGLDGISLSFDEVKGALNDLQPYIMPGAPGEIYLAIAAHEAGINALIAAGVDLETLSGSVKAGANGFYTEFSTTFSGSVQELRTSSAGLYASCLEILAGADALSSGCSGLCGAVGGLSSGADDLSQGASDVLAELPALKDGIDEMIDGVAELDDGLVTLSDDGLAQMRDTLDGLDGYLETLADRAAAYGSFMDARNAAISTVQFVMKTQGIGIAK